ncbi:MAG: DUF427 domain-containing protein [Acidimicrobiia bacterium]
MRPTPIPPGPGQESVWDYPRPPALVADDREVVIRLDGIEVARTRHAYRVLETSHPPTWYLPPDDVDRLLLEPGRGSSICEWKGRATYWDLVVGDRRLENVAWSVPEPTARFRPIADHLAFYPAELDITVDGIPVEPQPGGFYGGWITPEVVGPFKGGPGSWGW